ncbi:MAG TPA: hypothetical protein VF591_03500 [Pyrinomonadaceae bacterium]
MNAHTFRSMLRRQNVIPLTFFFLLAVIVACGFTAGTMQPSAEASVGNGRENQIPSEFDNPNPEKEFNDDDLKVKDQKKPRGQWNFSLGIDTEQFYDPSVPVAVSIVQSLSGRGKYAGVVKVKRLEVKNRSSKAVNSVQLRWKIFSFNDPSKVLLEGTLPFVNFWAEADNSKVIEIPTVYPVHLFNPLAKGGELNGRFKLMIGVQEARFADGSLWRRQAPAVSLNFLYYDQPVAGRFPRLASISSILPSLWADPGIARAIFRPCEAKPRPSASAFSFMSFSVFMGSAGLTNLSERRDAMNVHSFRSMLRRQNVVTFTFFFSLAVIVACGFTASTMQSPAEASVGQGRGNQLPPEFANQAAEDAKKDFNDDDLKVKDQKPRGKLAIVLETDMDQFNDASVPVAIGTIQSLSGGGKYAGVVKIKRLEIKNRSSKALNSVQLCWEIVSLDNPTKVLLEGAIPFVNFWAEANSSKVIEIPTIYPALFFKPLAKDNELNGQFQLTIGVKEAHFADGSFWRRQEVMTGSNAPYFDWTLSKQFPSLASILPDIPPPTWPDNRRGKITPCQAAPRSSASAFYFIRFQITSCKDDATTVIDFDTGKQSCGGYSPGQACYSDCSADGWCTVYRVPGGRCSSPTATPPTPTPTATPTLTPCTPPDAQPNPCCTPEPYTPPSPRYRLAAGTVGPAKLDAPRRRAYKSAVARRAPYLKCWSSWAPPGSPTSRKGETP